MKNKSVMTLGITILLSIGLTACSNSTETGNNDAAQVMAEITSTTESVAIEEAESRSLTEETTESVTIEETESRSLMEETTESVAIEDRSIEETAETENITVEESSIQETTEEKSTYTISELSQTMYATTNCNVRENPSTNDEVVSTLGQGEAVQVTGKVNEVNWYEIAIDGEKGYVSGSLLSGTKPVVEQSAQPSTPTQAENTQPSTPTQVENTQPSTPSSSTVDEDAPINPITGERMKPGDSYVDPTDGVRVHYYGNLLEYFNAQ